MVDLQKFVELANKYAPELAAGEDGQTLWVDVFAYIVGRDVEENAAFTITLLEYLKGREAELSKRAFAEDASDKDHYEWLPVFHVMESTWRTLTPEAVIQACIDVWEVME